MAPLADPDLPAHHAAAAAPDVHAPIPMATPGASTPQASNSKASNPIAQIAKAGLILAALVAAGYAARFSGIAVLAQIRPTAAGAAAFVVGAALISGAGMPRAVVAGAAGYAFGAWRGGALALLAQMLGCAADFWLARFALRGRATRFLRGRAARMDRFLAANPFTATLTLRLLPVGSNLALNLLAGLSGMRAWPFFAATLVGYVPQTLVFALGGSGVHVDRTYQVALGVGLFAVSAGLGWALLQSKKASGSF